MSITAYPIGAVVEDGRLWTAPQQPVLARAAICLERYAGGPAGTVAIS